MGEKSIVEERNKLYEFLLQNDAEKAKRILSKHERLVSAKDDAGRTAIHWAATGGCLEIVQYAVSLNPDSAYSCDEIGYTPLMSACAAGRLNIVRYLLDIKCDLNAVNNNGQAALHYAASKNHSEILILLIENGASINVQDKLGATPLHRAASQGHEKIVSILMRCEGLQIDLKDSTGCTPLHLACDEERDDAAILLVTNGADLYLQNKEEITPLQLVECSKLAQKLVAASNRYQCKN